MGAVIYTEDWDADAAGWVTINGHLTLNWSASGNPGGSLVGIYAEQEMPISTPDGFRADSSASGGAFTGNYWSDLASFSGWSLNFLAADILPSSLYVRFGDGINVYQANLLGQLGGVGSWFTLTTPGYEFGLGGWLGAGGAMGLSNALASVQWLEVRLDRNGIGQQNYYLDNFQILGTSGGGGDQDGGGGGEVIPEPTVGAFLLTAAACLGVMRRRIVKRGCRKETWEMAGQFRNRTGSFAEEGRRA